MTVAGGRRGYGARMAPRLAIHPRPALGDVVDAAVYAPVGHLAEGTPETWEVLPSRSVEEDVLEICCIPFFVYDINLCDRVRVTPADIDGSGDVVTTLLEVADDGGHWTFRVDLGDRPDPPLAELLERELTALGCRLEWWDPTLCAIDAPDAGAARAVGERLIALRGEGRLQYETGRQR